MAGADNQQERLLKTGWIVGFVDGEGSFGVTIFRQHTKIGFQVFPEFVVVQGAKSRTVLDDIAEFFGVGSVSLNKRSDNHREHMYRYCVRAREDLENVIVPFFTDHPLQTAKREDFTKFVRVLELMKEGRHLTHTGLIEIAEIVETMNRRKSKADLIRILRGHTPDIQDTG